MEDNAPAHKSSYTIAERLKETIPKVVWPANSPDFNPIERIWTLMKRRIRRRRGQERITTQAEMKRVLQEEWDKSRSRKLMLKLQGFLESCRSVFGLGETTTTMPRFFSFWYALYNSFTPFISVKNFCLQPLFPTKKNCI
jgi:hypothetical protein